MALLPVLEMLAALSGARCIAVVGPEPEQGERRISRSRALGSGFGLARATAEVRLAARTARKELAALLREPRIEIVRPGPERVLYANTNLWFGLKAGGSVGHVAGVVNGLHEAGIAVEVAALVPPPLVGPDVGFVELAPPRRFGLPFELNQYAYSQASARILAQRAGEGHDLIYQRMSIGSYAGAAAARASGVPLVLEYNGSEVWTARNWGTALRHEALGLAAEDASLRHAAVVVTVSRVLGDELESRGVDPARIVVYPNGVDPSAFQLEYLAVARARVRTELGFGEDDVVATFVGTFGRWHGVEVFAKAIRQLVDHDGGWLERARLRFMLVGDGLGMPQVREILGERGLAAATLTGLVPQADAPAYLAASDILVSPHVENADGSPFFGSPTKLFEYMVSGRAILASDLDQIGEVLRPALDLGRLRRGDAVAGDELALLVPPGDINALVEGLRLLAERSDLRVAIGSAARQRGARPVHLAASRLGDPDACR